MKRMGEEEGCTLRGVLSTIEVARRSVKATGTPRYKCATHSITRKRSSHIYYLELSSARSQTLARGSFPDVECLGLERLNA